MTIKPRLAVIAAAAASIAGAIVLPGTALAATTHPATVVASAPGPATVSGSLSGTIPGTSTACTSHWNWHVSQSLSGGYSEVEWTSNPCGYQIQDRSWCTDGVVGGYWATSGTVTGTDVWDRANCEAIAPINRAEEHFRSPGASWPAFTSYWSG
jgi:hypothetical protein